MKRLKLSLALKAMSVRKTLALAILGMVVAAVAAGAALATPPFLFTATQHARGTFEGHVKIKLRDSDAATVQVTQGVGGHSGWHAHPGTAIVIVKSGELKIVQAKDCSSRTYTAGQVAVEPPGHVHIARNTGATTLELWITFLNVPVGAPTRIDAPDPGCPASGGGGDDD